MKINITRYGTRALRIVWPPQIDEDILQEIVQFTRALKNGSYKIEDIHHGYHELLVQYNKKISNFELLKTQLLAIYQNRKVSLKKPATLWHIPACFDQDFAPDLAEYLLRKKLTKEQLVALHTQPLYTVYFIGFLPGFLYLGGMDQQLNLARKSTPSRLIKRGTIAVGGEQTGVYPQDSPGGWYGIAHTPISFFDAKSKIPCWAKPGDKVRFYAIDRDELHSMTKAVSAGNFLIKSELYEG